MRELKVDAVDGVDKGNTSSEFLVLSFLVSYFSVQRYLCVGVPPLGGQGVRWGNFA